MTDHHDEPQPYENLVREALTIVQTAGNAFLVGQRRDLTVEEMENLHERCDAWVAGATQTLGEWNVRSENLDV